MEMRIRMGMETDVAGMIRPSGVTGSEWLHIVVRLLCWGLRIILVFEFSFVLFLYLSCVTCSSRIPVGRITSY